MNGHTGNGHELHMVIWIDPLSVAWSTSLCVFRHIITIDEVTIDMQQVNPHFVVARLVGWPDAQDFAVDWESTVVTDAPLGF